MNWKKKFTSRKLWMSVAVLVFLIMVFCGASEDSATQIVAIIMAGATVIGYVVGEGLADKNGNVNGEVTLPGVKYPQFTEPNEEDKTE